MDPTALSVADILALKQLGAVAGEKTAHAGIVHNTVEVPGYIGHDLYSLVVPRRARVGADVYDGVTLLNSLVYSLSTIKQYDSLEPDQTRVDGIVDALLQLKRPIPAAFRPPGLDIPQNLLTYLAASIGELYGKHLQILVIFRDGAGDQKYMLYPDLREVPDVVTISLYCTKIGNTYTYYPVVARSVFSAGQEHLPAPSEHETNIEAIASATVNMEYRAKRIATLGELLKTAKAVALELDNIQADSATLQLDWKQYLDPLRVQHAAVLGQLHATEIDDTKISENAIYAFMMAFLQLPLVKMYMNPDQTDKYKDYRSYIMGSLHNWKVLEDWLQTPTSNNVRDACVQRITQLMAFRNEIQTINVAYKLEQAKRKIKAMGVDEEKIDWGRAGGHIEKFKRWKDARDSLPKSFDVFSHLPLLVRLSVDYDEAMESAKLAAKFVITDAKPAVPADFSVPAFEITVRKPHVADPFIVSMPEFIPDLVSFVI